MRGHSCGVWELPRVSGVPSLPPSPAMCCTHPPTVTRPPITPTAGTVRGLSSISVPSVNVDIMPPLGGPSPMADDDQVGFLDSTVLELLLTE